ncbi:MAG: apolipoprotein N-acyltransferase [Gallionella sp.]|jgi:apolipoprotein N-acyltransferase|nr:apolipoprotein N-acyltransferase [Gallionella sp.]
MFAKYQFHLLAFFAGAACVFGFAPFGLFPLPVLALSVLFILWQRVDTPSAAGWLGWSFGLGLFGAGIGWIYVALHDYGGMPMPLAALATLLFAAFLALFPALAGYAQARFPNINGRYFRSPEAEKRAQPGLRWQLSQPLMLGLLMPTIWVAIEWLRGTIFTGFPWLTLGYAHSGSPLAGYAPVLGVYGVSLAAAVSAGALALFWQTRAKRALGLLLAIWLGGALLQQVSWTQPQGEPLSVALVQGNIPQDIKFNPDLLADTLETYQHLVGQADARLTILPETAFPILREELPPLLVTGLEVQAEARGGDVLAGVFEHEGGQYYNSVVTFGAAPEQHYRKQHRVPFGEFIPLRFVLGPLINEVLNIPMGDLAAGDHTQAPLAVAGQQVAANICYEDVFGEEIIRALPQATLLANFTNDAWYGHSHAAAQHNQISQLRALETGRMMLRATNTGVTAIIGADGTILQQLPQHQPGILQGVAQGYTGATPYVRLGNAGLWLLLAGMLAYAWLRREPANG